MALVDLIMPQLGEGIMEATVLSWLKKEGQRVEEEEPIVEIATDKVDSEVPSTVAGIVKEIFYQENDIVKIGAILAKIETDIENNNDNKKENNELPTDSVPLHRDDSEEENDEIEKLFNKEIPLPQPENTSAHIAHAQATTGVNNGFYSPLVLNIARAEGIPFSDLEKIPGTGKDARLSKSDLLKYIEDRKGNAAMLQQSASQQVQDVKEKEEPALQQKTISPTTSGVSEIIEMDRMRKLIAHHMKESQNISATVTSFAEADVTAMVKWREKIKSDFEKREGTKITFTPMFIECIARVIRKYPLINSSVDGDRIIVKKDINIGMATALPSGNLIVPVIKNADNLNLVGLAHQVNNLGDKARKNKLQPADTQNGTFSVTNVGGFGSITGTPIINQPQVAILALGAIKKKPVVLETADGDVIAIRHMMILSLSYDHRIIDGAMGSKFLADIAKEFENWEYDY